MLSDAERKDPKSKSVETSNMELFISLLPTDVLHNVAKDEEEQDALWHYFNPYQEKGELLFHEYVDCFIK